jgi:hypothetical protein
MTGLHGRPAVVRGALGVGAVIGAAAVESSPPAELVLAEGVALLLVEDSPAVLGAAETA